MTVDLSEFIKLSRPKKPPCEVGVALEGLKPAEAEQLRAACATDPGIITNQAILEWLRQRGREISNIQRVITHRKGSCACNGR